jgi:hypothetical protein
MNLKSGWNRRSFLSTLGAAAGSLFAPARLNAEGTFARKAKSATPAVDGHPIVPITTGLGSTGDIYAELGVTPLININGTVTVIGGSVMKPEVMELTRQGNQHFVLINELEVAAGKFIAKLCKSPAGYTGLVTGGAAAAMVVGYAGMALPRQFNPQALGNVTPRYSWQIDPAKLKITGPEVMQKLADTRPVGIGSMGAGSSGMRGRDPGAPPGGPAAGGRHGSGRSSDPNSFGFAVWQLKDGEDKMIADRLVEIFSEASKA